MTFSKTLFDFHGRASRRDFWTVFVPCFVIKTAVFLVGLASGGFKLAFAYRIGVDVLLLWPLLAVCVRRLHDRGLSGWWLLMMTVGPIDGALKFGPMLGVGTALPAFLSAPLFVAHILTDVWFFVVLGIRRGWPAPDAPKAEA